MPLGLEQGKSCLLDLSTVMDPRDSARYHVQLIMQDGVLHAVTPDGHPLSASQNRALIRAIQAMQA